MENNSSPEQQRAAPEVTDDAIDRLVQQCGFVETEALVRIREAAIEALRVASKETAAALVLEYQLQGEEWLDHLKGREYERGQIGLIVARATLSRDMGDLKSFLYHVGDAREYALGLQENDIADVLERAPSIEIARTLSRYSEVFGFDQETIEEIASEPYDVSFETAYGYLTQAGLDADEILAAFRAE